MGVVMSVVILVSDSETIINVERFTWHERGHTSEESYMLQVCIWRVIEIIVVTKKVEVTRVLDMYGLPIQVLHYIYMLQKLRANEQQAEFALDTGTKMSVINENNCFIYVKFVSENFLMLCNRCRWLSWHWYYQD